MKNYLFTIILIMGCVSLFGQIKEIKGALFIQDTDIPIKFQEITITGGLNYSTFTNSKGEFTIPESKDSYVVSIYRADYQELVVHISNDMPYLELELKRSDMISDDIAKLIANVSLNVNMDEVNVYSNKKQEYKQQQMDELRGSVYSENARVKVEGGRVNAVLFPTDLLKGLPGVQILEGGLIAIRGAVSADLETQPLLVIDGSYTTGKFDDLDLSEIFSIKIVKGAEAAKYGLRGAAGVIEITTESGYLAKMQKKRERLNRKKELEERRRNAEQRKTDTDLKNKVL